MGNKHSHDRCTNREALARKQARRRATAAADEAEAARRGITVRQLHNERFAIAQQCVRSAQPTRRIHVASSREPWNSN